MPMRKLPKWAILALIAMLAIPITYALYIYATAVGDPAGTALCTIIVLVVGFIMMEVLLKPWFLLYRADAKDVKEINEIDATVEPKKKDAGAAAAARGDLRAKKRKTSAAEDARSEPRPLKEEIGEFMPGGKYADATPESSGRPIEFIDEAPVEQKKAPGD